MRKIALAVLALGALFVGWSGYRVYQMRQLEAQWRAAEVEMVRAQFGAYVARMQEAVGQRGRDELKALAEKFPLHDSGIAYQERLDAQEDGEFTVYAPRVGYVYLGSGADTAGIRPGERIVAIDGKTSEIRCGKDDKDCPDQAAVDRVKQLLDSTDRGRTRVSLGSGGHVWLVPVPYGQDIHDYIVAHTEAYTKQLDAVAPKVDALAAKVKTLDEKNIESLSAEARALVKEVQAPYEDFEAYMETRVILPPRTGAQAVPQL